MIPPANLNSPAFGFSSYSVFFNLLTLPSAYFLVEVFLSMPSPLTECKLLQSKSASYILVPTVSQSYFSYNGWRRM